MDVLFPPPGHLHPAPQSVNHINADVIYTMCLSRSSCRLDGLQFVAGEMLNRL